MMGGGGATRAREGAPVGSNGAARRARGVEGSDGHMPLLIVVSAVRRSREGWSSQLGLSAAALSCGSHAARRSSHPPLSPPVAPAVREQRFYYVLAAGCIPVRVDTYYPQLSFGRVAWPFKQTIQWHRAAVLLPPERLRRDGLLPTLLNISDAQIARMQEYIARVVRVRSGARGPDPASTSGLSLGPLPRPLPRLLPRHPFVPAIFLCARRRSLVPAIVLSCPPSSFCICSTHPEVVRPIPRLCSRTSSSTTEAARPTPSRRSWRSFSTWRVPSCPASTRGVRRLHPRADARGCLAHQASRPNKKRGRIAREDESGSVAEKSSCGVRSSSDAAPLPPDTRQMPNAHKYVTCPSTLNDGGAVRRRGGCSERTKSTERGGGCLETCVDTRWHNAMRQAQGVVQT